MRRIASMLLAAGLALTLVAPAAAQPAITVMINGRIQNFGQSPFIAGGRTLVPLRAIFEALSAQVAWDSATRTITASRGDRTVRLVIGQAAATVNGQTITLDVPAVIREGFTYVPLRFVSEALGAGVGWDGGARTVTIVDLNYLRSAGAPPAAADLLTRAAAYQGPVNGDLAAHVTLGPAGADPLITMAISGQSRGADAYYRLDQTVVFAGRPIRGTAEIAARGGKTYLRRQMDPEWSQVTGPARVDRLGTPGGVDPTRIFANPLIAAVGKVALGSSRTVDGEAYQELTVTIDPGRASGYFGEVARSFGASLEGVTFQQSEVRMLVRTGDGFPKEVHLTVRWTAAESGASTAYEMQASSVWQAPSGAIQYPASLP